MKSAGETAKLHYSKEHEIFMENAILARGLDFSTPGGRLCNPGHSIEVSWFLLHLNKVLLDPEIEKIALSALLGAFEIGWDKECGGGQGFKNYRERPVNPEPTAFCCLPRLDHHGAGLPGILYLFCESLMKA